MKIDLNKILNKEPQEYQKFHKKLKYKKIIKGKDSKSWPKSWKTVYFKSYPRLEELILPKPRLPLITLKKVLFNRKSERDYSKRPITTDDLSSLLYFCAGLREKTTEQMGNRFYPSGGARYPLEVYVISLNSDLPKGIYHYYLKSNSLEKLSEIDGFDTNKYFNYKWVENVSCVMLITAVFGRTTIKYGDRGYKYALIETGALMQNFYLNSEALGIGICAIAGFLEDKLNKLLNIDGEEETVLGVLGLGYKKEEA